MKLRRKSWWILALAVCLCLAAAGCSDSSNASKNNANQNTESSAGDNHSVDNEAQQEAGEVSEEDADTVKENAEESEDTESVDFVIETEKAGDAPEDQGDLKVWIQGEITVLDKGYRIEGTTNLEPGSELYAEADAKNYTMWGYNDRAEVGMDGRFEMEIKKPDVKGQLDFTIQFAPADQDSALHEIYGEKGERLQGPYVYQYLENDELYKQIQAFAHLDVAAEAGTVVEVQEPSWEKPEDYGAPTIWMKPEIKLQGEKYIVDVQSNLLEGAEVKGNVEIPDHWSIGYSDNATVHPDGSFQLMIKKPDVDGIQHFYIVIQFVPDENMWPNLKQAYGLHGQKLEGDLVKQEQNGEQMVKSIEMKVKVNVK